jgi:deoxyribodipyrimidine photolyase-related protein
MTIGIWILGDQLNLQHPGLCQFSAQKQSVRVILIESKNYAQERRYHQQKLILVWSAMRHFSVELQQLGWQVFYSISDDFQSSLKSWIEQYKITELIIMEPGDRPFLNLINNLQINCPIHLLPNNQFLWSREEFKIWTQSRKKLLLEDFYREGRRKFKILMDDDHKPLGGKWNFDQENRKPLQKNLNPPQALYFQPDNITLDVIEKVHNLDFPTYGNSLNFNWGVTRQQALLVLDHFTTHILPNFGAYQDAMLTNQYTMWHSLISPYLNVGLLQPFEVIKAVENAYYQNNLPLNSVEGFIRQVLGWREYMSGVYHYVSPSYFQSNWFNHNLPLPDFYWNSQQTNLNCLHQVLKQVENTGYAHHIQRLMILSNFALILGVNPQELESWFHAVFIDAYDWVMQPNVLGMGQFADGGIFASKPYASSANYINKMSDYCQNCSYQKNERSTANSCPFNYLYWDFLHRHQDQLKTQGRMNLVLKHLDKMTPEELEKINSLSQSFRAKFNTLS